MMPRVGLRQGVGSVGVTFIIQIVPIVLIVALFLLVFF